MDIASLVIEQSKLEIVSLKEGKPIGLSVLIRSPESDEIKRINREWQDKMLDSGDFEVSSKLIEQKSMDIRLASIASWEWKKGHTFDGKEPDNSDEFKRFVLTHKLGWFIKDQIDNHFKYKANFTRDLPKA